MHLKETKELLSLYKGLGYITLFATWRCAHAPYPLVEKFIPKKGRIADLGCGYGLFSNFIALKSNQRYVLGMDISKHKIKYANRGLKNTKFFLADVMKWNEKVDGIALNHLLHHLNSFKQQEEFLKKCFRNLKLKGKLVILEIDNKPLLKFLITQIVDNVAYPGDHFYFRSSQQFKELLKKIGFKKVDIVNSNKGTFMSHIIIIAEK